MSFLAYSDTDAEHDFLRIVTHIRRPGEVLRKGLRSRMSRRRPTSRWEGKLVVVIDELDKLTDTEEGKDCLDVLLSSLKNLFTAAGVHFLFVGGPDLHWMAQRANYRGNSVYESVFGWQLYVPCVWRATEQLLEAVTGQETSEVDGLPELRDYLEFKSRGIPRLLLMEFNALVHWRERRPLVDLDASDVARIEFYAGLQRTLADFLAPADELRPFTIPIDEDRWRLGAYYVTDWILRSQGTSFTIQDIARTKEDPSVETTLDPLLVRDPRKVQELLDHLVERDIIEPTNRDLAAQTYLGGLPREALPAYRISAHVHQRLAGFARTSERERADLAHVPTVSTDASETARASSWNEQWDLRSTLDVVAEGRFALIQEISLNATTRTYRAIETSTGDVVTVKLLDGSISGDEGDIASSVRARFQREARLAAELDHPNILTLRDVFVEADGRSGIVLDYVSGPSLAQVCRGNGLHPTRAVAIATALLSALGYLNERGLARIDLKPQHVVIAGNLRPVIVDFGLVKRIGAPSDGDFITSSGISLGTPAYTAPEQLLGEPVDIRGDLYSLALVLIEMLTGRIPRMGAPNDNLAAMLRRAAHEDIDTTGLPVSQELRKVLRRALQRDPEARYPLPADLADALRLTPEGKAA